MAVTTQFGIPDTTGAHATLMPKLQYRFRVSFSGLGADLATDTTTQNVISVGRPSIQLNHETQGAKAADDKHAGNVYKFTMKIETLDGTADANPYDTWTLAGCYLSNVQYGDLNYGTSELVQVTATIRYDNASNEIFAGNTEKDTLGE
mgnify:CR=1 FL=1